MGLSDNNDKLLWIWIYHTGQAEITHDTVGRIELFYAADEKEARECVEERRKAIEEKLGTVYEESMKPSLRGFALAHSYYDGIAHFNPDGTLKEPPIHSMLE